jgi:hypothetical protein
MIRNWQDVLTASRGTLAVNDNVEVVTPYVGVRIDDDAVIILKKGNVDVTSSYVTDPTLPVAAGTLIIAKATERFLKFQAVSGKATLILD